MRRPSTQLVVLALALLGGLIALWVAGVFGERPGERARFEERLAALEPGGGHESPSLAGAVSLEEAALERAALQSGQEGARRGEARELLTGRVLFPPGAPSDPTLEVVALFTREPLEPAQVRDPLRHELLEGQSRERAAVDGEGGFSMLRPLRAERALLFVRGRYLRLARPRALEARELEAQGAGAQELVLEPVLGAWLTGRMLAPPGAEELARGAEGAELELIPTGEGDQPFFAFLGRLGRGASTSLDAELAFEFRAASPGGELLLTLDPRVFPQLVELVPPLAPGEARELVLRARRGASIAGRVLDERGEPLAEVEIEEERRGFNLPSGNERSATSAEDGSFRLLGLRPGRARLVLTREDRPELRTDELELVEGALLAGLELVLPAGGKLTGRVRWPEGEPAAGAQLFARALAGGSTRGARTGEDGRFELVGLADGPHALDAWLEPRSGAEPAPAPAAEGRAQRAPIRPGPEAWWAEAPSIDPRTAHALELELAPPLAVSGRVVDERGEALESFVVSARGSGAQSREARVESGDGSFRLGGLRPGRWLLQAMHQGGAARSEELALELPGGEGPHLLVLPRSVTVAGRVLDPAGNPVAAASVSARGPDRSLTATCDGEGRFRLERVAARGTRLRAHAEGFAASAPFELDALPGATLAALELVLRPGGRVIGLVLARDGTPDAGAQVSAFGAGMEERGDARPRGTRADESGHFALEGLEPGTWQIAAMPDVGRMVERLAADEADPASFLNEMRMLAVEVVDGRTIEVVLGRRSEAPVTLAGVVLEAGRGLARVTVIALREGEALGAGMRAATTRQDGSFELELPAPGPVLLVVQNERFGESVNFPFDVPAVERHEVRLELPGGRVAGRVEDREGSPVPGVRVALEREDRSGLGPFAGIGNDETTDKEGEFAFERLRPGRYGLRAEHESRGSAFLPGLVLEADGELKHVRIELAEGGRIEGRVLRSDGSPAPGAAIFARDGEGRLHRSFTRVVADSGGHFRYGGLPAGRWSLSARSAEGASAESAPVTVEPGAAAELELVLAGGTTLVVVLEGDSGETLRASVSVVDEAGREQAGLASPSDLGRMFSSGFSTRETRVGPLPAGRYTVSAHSPEGLLRKKPVTLSGSGERKLVLRVE